MDDFSVRHAPRIMDQLETILNAEERFGETDEEVASHDEAVEKVLDNPLLRFSVEINEHIFTKYNVKVLHEDHIHIIVQIEITETYITLQAIIDLITLI